MLAALLSIATLALVMVAPANGDFLNSYLNDKRFGKSPGPCESEADKCAFNYDELPDKIKDITVCVMSGVCPKIGDVVKAGRFEIWELECQNVGVGSMNLEFDQSSATSTRVRGDFAVDNLRLACSFQLNIISLVLEIAGTFRIETTISDTAVSFPNQGQSGRIDGRFPIELQSTDFATELPNRIELPYESCDLDVALGLSLLESDFDLIRGCAYIPWTPFTFLISGWQCATLVGPGASGIIFSFLYNLFQLDHIVSAVARIIESLIGGIVCQIVEEFAVLENGSNGVLNDVLLDIKATIDEWALSSSLDPLAADAAAAGLDPTALNFSDSTLAGAFSAGINDWLGEPDLLINQLIELATEPDGAVAADLVALDLAPEVTLPLLVADVTVRLSKVGLGGLNTFSLFHVLETRDFDYTVQNQIALDDVSFEVDIFTRLAPGEWVTRGTAESDFQFTFGLRLAELYFDAHILALFDLDRLDSVRVGQILNLPASETIFADAVVCLAPAFYSLNFTNLEASVDQVLDASVSNFDGDGLSQLIENSVEFGAAALRGAFKDKLPGIARGPVRSTLNDLILEYVTLPGREGTQDCPATGSISAPGELYELDLEYALFARLGALINATVGGDPIQDTDVDINDLVDVVLRYFVDTNAYFPFVPAWELAPSYRDIARLPAFNRPNDYIHLQNLAIGNLDSIYRLLALDGGFRFAAGIGTPARPLRFTVPIEVQHEGDGLLESFNLTLELTEVAFAVRLAALALDAHYVDRLYITQLLEVQCVLGSLEEIAFAHETDALSVGQVSVLLDRQPSSSPSSLPLVQALDALEAISSLPEPGGRFEHLVNFVLQEGLTAGLNLVETLPSYYEETDPATCSEAFDPIDFIASLSFPVNLTTYVTDVCLGPLAEDSLQDAQSNVIVDDPDNVFDLSQSTVVELLAELVDRITLDGGLSAALKVLANNSGSVLADAFVLDDDGDVDFVFPLALVGLKWTYFDLGTLRISKVDRLVQQFDVFQPQGAYVTSYAVSFNETVPLDVSIETVFEVPGYAVGEPSLETVREEVDFGFQLVDFEFSLQLLTAFNPSHIGNLTLGHFFTVDDDTQALGLADSALDCAVSSFHTNGLLIHELGIRINDLQTVTVASRNHELVSTEVELLIESFTLLAVDFYKGAIENIAQNCFRTYINDYLAELADVAECPDASDIEPTHAGILRFNESPDWLLLQDLWSQVAISDDYASLNAALDAAVSTAILFSEERDEQLFFADVPLLYYGTSYGTLDLGIANVRLENLQISELLPAVPTEAPYETLTRLKIPDKASLGFTLEVNARGLLQDQPISNNKLDVKLSVSDFDFGFWVRLKVNLTSALELRFATLSSLDQVACLVIPVEEFAPLALNLSASSLDLYASCLSCDLPMLRPFEEVAFENENGAQLAGLLQNLVVFTTDYLIEVNAQEIVDVYLATAHITCDELLDLLVNFLEAEPETTTIATTLGISFAGVTLACTVAYACVYPVHKMRRKQALLANLQDADDHTDLAQVLTNTALASKALFQHPTTTRRAKIIVPAVVAFNFALVVWANLYSGALTILLKLEILGAETQYIELVPLTVGLLVNSIWQDLSKIIAILLALSTLVMPVALNAGILVVWFTPHTILPLGYKHLLLRIIEVTGKIAFVIVFILAVTIAVLYTSFTLADYNELEFLPEGLLSAELNVAPERGLTLVTLIGVFTLLLSHYVSFLHHQLTGRNKRRLDDIDGFKSEAATIAAYSKRALMRHRFLGRDREGQVREMEPVKMYTLVALIALDMILVIVAISVPVITFRITGVLGLAMQEISDGSPTIPADESLHIRTFSMIDFGERIGLSPHRSEPVDSFRIVYLQVLYFVVFLLAPVFQLALMIATLIMPLTLRSLRQLASMQRIVMYWAGLDLAVLTLVSITFVIGPLVEVYVNYVSEVITDDLCESLQASFSLLILEEENAKCLSTASELEPGIAFVFLAVFLHYFVAVLFFVIADVAISDRYFAAYHMSRSDARPRSWPQIVIRFMQFCTRTVPGDAAAVPEGSAPTSIFAPAKDEENDERSGLLCTILRYYTGARNAQGETIEDETDRRIAAWRKKFGPMSAAVNPKFDNGRVDAAQDSDSDDIEV
ncbi:Hypothetical Protein FCC1311_016862 [Hondaea fermentalgiana]|uniref:Uncharacterized protein n=1 Tax=Hondaea fermentalgiana TaxID=2315210 RepID=A0A2R5G358_9STRA|nr:Hypothetical Protein FCC1311_016862 [Hondaea fermentalgiana]|eukprot:GBG25467.1 Hypothetical Protein FCC1311_016862 [Hondaea fermentalgiana]